MRVVGGAGPCRPACIVSGSAAVLPRRSRSVRLCGSKCHAALPGSRLPQLGRSRGRLQAITCSAGEGPGWRSAAQEVVSA